MFTPNNDTWNDVWGINSISNENFKVFIFDRYGKLLKVFETINDKWDGTYHGMPMPATGYWFKIVLDDRIVKTGHLALKR
ncbi:MAG: T9SS type B sorting domain-containing protein [Gelidibacter sp.]